MKDKLLTIKEVADYLRVSERSVLRYIEAGRLKAVMVLGNIHRHMAVFARVKYYSICGYGAG